MNSHLKTLLINDPKIYKTTTTPSLYKQHKNASISCRFQVMLKLANKYTNIKFLFFYSHEIANIKTHNGVSQAAIIYENE